MTVCGGWSCVVMRYQRHQASTGHQSLSHTLTLHRSRSCHCHTTTISPAFCPLPDFRAYSVIGVNTGGGTGKTRPPEFVVGGRQCYSSPPDFGQLDIFCVMNHSAVQMCQDSHTAHCLVPTSRCGMTRIIALCRCAAHRCSV